MTMITPSLSLLLLLLVSHDMVLERSSAFVPHSWIQPRPLVQRNNDAVSLFATRKDSSKTKEYVRWNKRGDLWEMQTAVTTFRNGNETVELHGQLHFGDPAYFEFYNSAAFDSLHQSVHYELLVDNDLITYENGIWRLKSSIMASPNDQVLAQQYGWSCQVDSIDYTKPKWVHADLTRQEFLKVASKGKESNAFHNDKDNQDLPLWKLAGTNPQSSSAAAEALSALLVGPPSLSYSQKSLKRRLFTNLFLPGNSFAKNIRALLWLTVPAPELSIMLLDWSSILRGSNTKAGGGLSPIAIPTLKAMLNLDLQQARKFLFGQVLTSTTTTTATDTKTNNDPSMGWNLLVTKRNDHALRVLEKTIRDYRSTSSKPYSTALLYGSSHCPDLHEKLVAKGFVPTQTTWRSAWTVQERSNIDERFYLVALTTIMVLYLGVGALDWITIMKDVSQAWVQSNYAEAGVAIGLYLVRHVLLYLGLSKVLIDWNPSTTNNDNIWTEITATELKET